MSWSGLRHTDTSCMQQQSGHCAVVKCEYSTQWIDDPSSIRWNCFAIYYIDIVHVYIHSPAVIFGQSHVYTVTVHVLHIIFVEKGRGVLHVQNNVRGQAPSFWHVHAYVYMCVFVWMNLHAYTCYTCIYIHVLAYTTSVQISAWYAEMPLLLLSSPPARPPSWGEREGVASTAAGRTCRFVWDYDREHYPEMTTLRTQCPSVWGRNSKV